MKFRPLTALAAGLAAIGLGGFTRLPEAIRNTMAKEAKMAQPVDLTPRLILKRRQYSTAHLKFNAPSRAVRVLKGQCDVRHSSLFS